MTNRDIIAIDPDSEKSGVAYIEGESGTAEATSLPFPDLLDYVRWAHAKAKESGRELMVYVEGGWQNKSNWHLPLGYVSKEKAAAIGRSVGMNHQTGKLLVGILEKESIPHMVVKPLRKIWHGADGKITAEELAKVFRANGLEPLQGRTNQDARDAALIAVTERGRV